MLSIEKAKEKRDHRDKVKMAALASGKYAAHLLFPEYFSAPKKDKNSGPHALSDPNDDIDYGQVEWQTPAQDDWLTTQRLLKEHENSKVKATHIDGPNNESVNFDEDIPPLPMMSQHMDADDLEWE